MLEEKRITLIEEVNGQLYRIMPESRFDQVYDNDNFTLTEIIQKINEELDKKGDGIDVSQLRKELDALVAEVPAEFNTLKKITDYINLSSEDSEIHKALDLKLDRALISDESLEKINNIYSADEIDALHKAIEAAFEEKINTVVTISNEETAPKSLRDNSLWFQVVNHKE